MTKRKKIYMKKILLAIALTITLGFGAKAQFGVDGFFNDWEESNNIINIFYGFDNGLRDPGLPGGHGGGDQPAPLGSGLLILTALGAGYALKKKHEK